MKRVWLPLQGRFQGELLKRGHCVGCTKSLAGAQRKALDGRENLELVTCACRRVYLYDKMLNSYKRAELEDFPHGANT